VDSDSGEQHTVKAAFSKATAEDVCIGATCRPATEVASHIRCALMSRSVSRICCFCVRREGELQSAAFGANEASCHLNELRAQVDQLAAATRSAEETAAAATGAQSWP
jgi:hypothetical protein